MRKGRFAGTGQVFRFTLQQYLKSTSTIATMIVLLLVSIGSLLMASVGMSNGLVETTDLKEIIVANETGYVLLEDDVRAADELLGQMPVTIWDSYEEARNVSGIRTAVVVVSENGGLHVRAEGNDIYTELSDDDLQRAADAVSSALENARIREMDVDLGTIDMLFAPVSAGTQNISEYLQPQGESRVDYSTRYMITLFYAVVAMVLVNFSTSYIVRAVIEEKASKLVELLMVSVRPMALVLGKILASMCLVLAQIALLTAGFAASYFASSRLFGMKNITLMFEQMGIGEIFRSLDVGAIGVLVVSVLLTYLGYSFVAGLAGVRCSNMSDVDSANSAVVMLAMLGYIVSVSTVAVEGTGVTVLSLIPLVNMFVAPTRYLLGEIGMGVLLGAWVVQIAWIAALAFVCDRVYGALLMRRGAKVKFKDVFALAGSKGGERL